MKPKWVRVGKTFFNIHRVVAFEIHMRSPGTSEEHGVYVYFDFAEPMDVKRKRVVCQNTMWIGEYDTKENCEKLVEDIINGEYDVGSSCQ